MQVILVNPSKSKLNLTGFQTTVDHILKRLSKNKTLKNRSWLKKDEITLAFVSASRMRALNFEFRQKDYSTDVLSFASSEPESLGELILCLSVLKKQAKQHHHPLEHEILYMLIHGVLHLLGYDHERSRVEEQKMFVIQDRLFSQLTETKINLNLIHVDRRRSQ